MLDRRASSCTWGLAQSINIHRRVLEFPVVSHVVVPPTSTLISHTLVNGYNAQLYCSIIFANVWQFLISMVYIQYNALLSSLLSNREWHGYGCRKKALRVSFPCALQRSTYFISMPWRYGIPQMITISALHWILSQSVFVIPLQSFTHNGDAVTWWEWPTVGFSVWAIITGKTPLRVTPDIGDRATADQALTSVRQPL